LIGAIVLEKQRLKKMALAAEVLGGAAVVITLVFLVLETRENTRAVQAQSYLALTSELNRVRENLFDAEIAGLFADAIRDQSIPDSPADALVVRQIFESVFAIYESAYYAKRKGVLDESEWSRFDQAICRNMRNSAMYWGPNESAVLGQGIRGVLTESFANYAENKCD